MLKACCLAPNTNWYKQTIRKQRKSNRLCLVRAALQSILTPGGRSKLPAAPHELQQAEVGIMAHSRAFIEQSSCMMTSALGGGGSALK